MPSTPEKVPQNGSHFISWPMLAFLLLPGLGLVMGPNFSFLSNPPIYPFKVPLALQTHFPPNLVKMSQTCTFSILQSRNSHVSDIHKHVLWISSWVPGTGLKPNPSLRICGDGRWLLLPLATAASSFLMSLLSFSGHWLSCTGPVCPHIHLFLTSLFSSGSLSPFPHPRNNV